MKKYYFCILIMLLLIISCPDQTNTGGGSKSSSSSDNDNNDSPNKFTVYAGDTVFKQINTVVNIAGTASGYTNAFWTQISGTPVDDFDSDELDLTFKINPLTANFEELTFRLTAANGFETLTSDITVIAVKYKNVYRLGTFDTVTPGHKTEWKLDWPFGDSNGENDYEAGYWFTFDDSEATGHATAPGNAVVLPKPIDTEDKLFAPGYNDTGMCLNITYTHATNGYLYTFIGFGIKFADNPDPNYMHPFDLSSTHGVAFRIKSPDPKSLKVCVLSKAYQNTWGSHYSQINATTDWQLLEYEWQNMSWPQYAPNPVSVNDALLQCAGIQFQTTSQMQGENGIFYIDDVFIYEM